MLIPLTSAPFINTFDWVLLYQEARAISSSLKAFPSRRCPPVLYMDQNESRRGKGERKTVHILLKSDSKHKQRESNFPSSKASSTVQNERDIAMTFKLYRNVCGKNTWKWHEGPCRTSKPSTANDKTDNASFPDVLMLRMKQRRAKTAKNTLRKRKP
jgi:hypothetical protein